MTSRGDVMVTTATPTAPVSAPAAAAPATSLGKALAVLDAFRGPQASLGLTQIAAASGVNKTTAYRLLAVLVAHGYVERHDERYRLGRRLFELGSLVDECRPHGLRTLAVPYLAGLYE